MDLSEQIKLVQMREHVPYIMPVPYKSEPTHAQEVNRILLLKHLMKQADDKGSLVDKAKKLVYDKRTSQYIPVETMLAKEATLISADGLAPINRQEKSKGYRQLVAKNGAETAKIKLLDESKPLPKASIEKKAFVGGLIAGARGLATVGRAVAPHAKRGVMGTRKAKRLAGSARRSFKGLPKAQQSGIKAGAGMAGSYLAEKARGAISDKFKVNKATKMNERNQKARQGAKIKEQRI